MLSFHWLAKLARLRLGLPFVRRGDQARASGEWVEAVIDYHRGLEWMPWREDLKVQIGNCLKEFGDYRGAMRAYASVSGGLSLSEARKQAADASRRAGGNLLPFAVAETAETAEAADRPRARDYAPDPSARLLPNRILLDPIEPRGWLGPLGQDIHLSQRLRGTGYASIKLDQVGAMVVEREGAQEPLFAGVVAVRGRIFSISALHEAELRIGEGDAGFATTVALRPARGRGPLRLYVFNAWIDTAAMPPGRYWLAVSVGHRIAPTGLFVNVVDVTDETAFSSSNGFVASPGDGDPADVIAAAPAEIRSAARTLFDHPVRSILALRVDQLGDVAASLAALSRLHAIFPEARLVVLARPEVQAIIAASAVAHEVLSITLDYDPVAERRSLDPAEEERVRAALKGRLFDLAIDLSPGDESRPLLLMTGATYLVGFNPDRFGFLDFGIAVRSRDKVNQQEKLSHAAAVTMLVEALAVAITPARAIVPRPAEPAVLRSLGLQAGGYVVLHLGARHAINRWPVTRFVELCDRLLAEAPYDVVLFVEPDAPELEPRAGGRVHLLTVVDPAVFDIVLSGAKIMVGNDSGPKHLAAARGVPTVSVHVDRLNWNEWGQDGIGAIVSKRVPCTGCGLNDIDLCGRDAVCVRSITAEEVFAALLPFL